MQKDSDSEDNIAAKPRAKKRISPTSDDESDSSSSKSPAKARTARLSNRHDPRILKKKEDEMKRQKRELEMKKTSAVERAKKGQKIDEDDAAAFENQKRLFNEFYNRRLKKEKKRNFP
jgi:hypothetical protein